MSSSGSSRCSPCSRSCCGRRSGDGRRSSWGRSRSPPRSRSARSTSRGRASVGLALLVVVGLGAPALAALTRSRLALAVGAAGGLRRLRVRARVLDRDELAGRARPASRRRRPLLRDLEPGRDAAPRAGAARRGAARRRPLPLVGVCVLVVVGASGLGADGGGVLVFAAGYLFLWLRLRGVALTWRNLVLAARPRSGPGSLLVGLDAAARRLEPRHPHARRRPGCPGRRARAPLARLARRLRLRLAGDRDHHVLAAVLVWLALRRPRFAAVDAVLVALAVSLLVNDSPRDVAAYGALSCAALRFWEEARRVQ